MVFPRNPWIFPDFPQKSHGNPRAVLQEAAPKALPVAAPGSVQVGGGSGGWTVPGPKQRQEASDFSYVLLLDFHGF